MQDHREGERAGQTQQQHGRPGGPTCEVRVDAALHAHLRRAARPRLCRAPRHLAEREQVGRAAQRLSRAPLAERAEAARVRALVRVVDVPAGRQRVRMLLTS